MLRWLTAKKEEYPSYSLLKEIPSRGLPKDLAEQESSSDYDAWRDRIQSDLMNEPADENAPNFATFLKAGNGLLQIRMPESGALCLLVFSTPLRAADYAMVQVPDQKLAYFCSSAAQVASVVTEFRERAGVEHVALDRCPRCSIFTTVSAGSLDIAPKVIDAWKIWKSTEVARCRLYFDYAQAAARAGNYLLARDVALELVGHVTTEYPQAHLLLGKLAIQLRDKRLLGEAKNFLQLLRQDLVIKDLDAASKTGVQF